MKNKGHTWTLFIQAWKYKWSRKYEKCIKCGTCNKKHKSKWLCSSCYDKKRKENPKRVFNLKLQSFKFHFKNRALQYLTKTKRKPKKKYSDLKKYRKEYYEKNKEVLSLISKTYRRRKRNLPCLKMYIWDKTIYFPFEWIDKPANFSDSKYWEYKQRLKEFTLIKNFYEK